ncbi:hypothetical protein ACQRUO_28425, partial [Kitasatospora sp. LaBMicrA B282]
PAASAAGASPAAAAVAPAGTPAAEAAGGVREAVVRLLATGLTQRAVAVRLRLSERTVAGHLAELRAEYDADTLFQLGWQLRGRAPRR